MISQPILRIVLLAPLLVFARHSSSAEPSGSSAIPNQEFEEISLRLSENNGFFPTDNLVSNETSYLHVLPQIRNSAKAGAVYIGVGPEQNFSYIVHAKPSLAFIVDIRRDNLLHHLWLKEIFIQSRNRAEFMSKLFGRPLPADWNPDPSANAAQLVDLLEGLQPDREYYKSTLSVLWQGINGKFPQLTKERDWNTIGRIAMAFYRRGLDLTYEIPGRPELSFFPSWGALMEETDRDGVFGHYLSSEESFRFLKRMSEENRLIPVVGNLAGSKALRGVGEELKRRNLSVSTLYLSNVEFYLFRNGTMSNFVDNVKALPIDSHSILIRSYFNQLTGYRESHPHSVAGHLSVSLVQRIGSFLENAETAPYLNYWDLVNRDYIPTPLPSRIADP